MSRASVILLVAIPWQWLPAFDLGSFRHLHAPPPTTAAPPARLAQLTDDVVVRALDRGRTAFVGCWKRARNVDPLLDATKIKLRVEIDAAGTVVNVTHDAPTERLGNCLTAVARGMVFGVPDAAAFAEFPLFFQPD
jgi:hypothetical protein